MAEIAGGLRNGASDHTTPGLPHRKGPDMTGVPPQTHLRKGLCAAAAEAGRTMLHVDAATQTLVRLAQQGGPSELALDAALHTGHGEPWQTLPLSDLDRAWNAFGAAAPGAAGWLAALPTKPWFVSIAPLDGDVSDEEPTTGDLRSGAITSTPPRVIGQ